MEQSVKLSSEVQASDRLKTSLPQSLCSSVLLPPSTPTNQHASINQPQCNDQISPQKSILRPIQQLCNQLPSLTSLSLQPSYTANNPQHSDLSHSKGCIPASIPHSPSLPQSLLPSLSPPLLPATAESDVSTKQNHGCKRCPYCKKSYAHRSSLSKHITKVHSTVKEDTKFNNLQCNLCTER